MSTEEDLKKLPVDEVMDLMEESGCDKQLKVWQHTCIRHHRFMGKYAVQWNLACPNPMVPWICFPISEALMVTVRVSI